MQLALINYALLNDRALLRVNFFIYDLYLNGERGPRCKISVVPSAKEVFQRLPVYALVSNVLPSVEDGWSCDLNDEIIEFKIIDTENVLTDLLRLCIDLLGGAS